MSDRKRGRWTASENLRPRDGTYRKQEVKAHSLRGTLFPFPCFLRGVQCSKASRLASLVSFGRSSLIGRGITLPRLGTDLAEQGGPGSSRPCTYRGVSLVEVHEDLRAWQKPAAGPFTP